VRMPYTTNKHQSTIQEGSLLYGLFGSFRFAPHFKQ
jgi:hypothetical protein